MTPVTATSFVHVETLVQTSSFSKDQSAGEDSRREKGESFSYDEKQALICKEAIALVMVNGKFVFNVHWPNSLGLVEGFCMVCKQPWI